MLKLQTNTSDALTIDVKDEDFFISDSKNL